MAETSETKSALPGSTNKVGRRSRMYTRARTNAYFSTAAGLVFLAAFLLYLGFQLPALVSAISAFIVFPLLAMSDRVCFDGKRLYRTGIAWRLSIKLFGRRQRVKPKDVVHVETQALRAMRRGHNIIYRFRTSFHAADQVFSIGSGHGYRKMVAEVLPMIAESCLDVRSIELRDHLSAARDVEVRARQLHIPRSDVLDPKSMFKREGRDRPAIEVGDEDLVRAEELRAVGNQLRTSGRLLQALEAFRRGLRIMPENGRLIYEIARCLQSLAASRRDPLLDRKAQAMLRLAERRSGHDTDLLMWLGETYFSMGALRRAETVFKRAASNGSESYRILRGLGELALREGRIAHAVNYFSNAAGLKLPAPLRRWARSEANYLRNLNDNEDYMDIEVSRLNLYDNLEGARRTSRKVFIFGIAVIASGFALAIEPIIDVGWAVSAVSLVIWLATSLFRHMFASRIPFELLDKD